VTRLEYLLSAALLRIVSVILRLLPLRRGRVTLATARLDRLDGNLRFIHDAIRRLRPEVRPSLILEPYSYGIAGKLAYVLRTIRGMYLLETSSLFVVDNAYLPVHVMPHRRSTTVVQVWHAEGALKRFGRDTAHGLSEPERSFLHHNYDWVVTSGETAREPWSRAFMTPLDHVLALGSPRTDLFRDEAELAAARARVIAANPGLAGRRVVLYAPTFRGRGRDKHAGPGFDAARLRAALPSTDVLALKGHPNLDQRHVAAGGFDVVVDQSTDLNELLAVTDILITDYSSVIFDAALLRLPVALLLPDLDAYRREPGLYLDPEHELIGTRVHDTDALITTILGWQFDLAPYAAFVERHLGPCDGHASERFVERFLPRAP
jgi:CDP-ribitol ribitolphosphotransferase